MNRPPRRRQTLLLGVLAVGMFGFAFALVPLYDIFCEITGLNGKTSNQAALLEEVQSTSAAETDRLVTINLLGQVARGLPWEFQPVETELVVRPGELTVTTYHARNRGTKTVVAQAVPSVSPGRAAKHLKKIECFCFEAQELAPGAAIDMPVRFLVDSELPPEIVALTLSYTMFPLPDAEAGQILSRNEGNQ